MCIVRGVREFHGREMWVDFKRRDVRVHTGQIERMNENELQKGGSEGGNFPIKYALIGCCGKSRRISN